MNMVNVSLDEIVGDLRKLSQDGKELSLDDVVDLCTRDYNIESEKTILNLEHCIELNFMRKLEEKYEKLS